MTLHLLNVKNQQLWPTNRGHDPPPWRSSTRGLNDARFRGRWAGKPRSSETGPNRPRSRHFNAVAQFAPSRSLPTVSANQGEEFRERWRSSIYHGQSRISTALMSSVTQTSRYRKGRGLITKSFSCGSHYQPGSRCFSVTSCWSEKCRAGGKGNLLSKLLSSVTERPRTLLYALCKYLWTVT